MPQQKNLASLDLLSEDTSSGQRSASTSGAQTLRNERKLIAAVMARHPELTEEEARRELELFGGL